MTPQREILAVGFLCVYMILLMGLRYRVGLDTINYMSSFSQLPSWHSFAHSNIFENRFEPGYMAICILCKSVSKDFWLVQLIFSAITNIGIFVFIYRYCKNPFWGIFTYIVIAWLYFSAEIMRESAAISVFLLNYENLRKHNWIKYYLFSIFSIILHFSAIFIWFFPLVTKLKHVSKYYIMLVLLFATCMPFFENINEYLTGSIALRVAGNLDRVETINMNWRIAFLLRSAVLPAFSIYIAHRNHIYEQFKPFVLFHILLCAGSFSIPLIFLRFTNYTILFVCVYVSNLIVCNRLTSFTRVCIVGLMLLSHVHYYSTMKDRWIPYHSIVNPVKDKTREKMWLDQ